MSERTDSTTVPGVPQTSSGAGKYVILVMVALAILGAAVSLWYHYQKSARASRFWGSRNAEVIARNPRAQLLKVEPYREDADYDETIEYGDVRLGVIAREDVTHARGFAHVREVLLQDATFDWNAPEPAPPLQWEYALRMTNGFRKVVVLISFESARLGLLGEPRTVALTLRSNAGLKTFVEEQFPRKAL